MPPPLTPTKDYFTSPITTISRSAISPKNISRQDTIEAYRAFTEKFREEASVVLEEKRRHKMLKLLRDNSASIYAALQRDLKFFMAPSSWNRSLSREEAEIVLSEHLRLPLGAARFLAQIIHFPLLSTQFKSELYFFVLLLPLINFQPITFRISLRVLQMFF